MNLLEKIIAEIERLREASLASESYHDALDDILVFINSLPKKSISEDLNTAAKVYADNITDKVGYKLQLRRAVVYGAQWHKEQIMKDTIKATAHPEDYELWCNLSQTNLQDGQEVKVIVIKED